MQVGREHGAAAGRQVQRGGEPLRRLVELRALVDKVVDVGDEHVQRVQPVAARVDLDGDRVVDVPRGRAVHGERQQVAAVADAVACAELGGGRHRGLEGDVLQGVVAQPGVPDARWGVQGGVREGVDGEAEVGDVGDQRAADELYEAARGEVAAVARVDVLLQRSDEQLFTTDKWGWGDGFRVRRWRRRRR